MKKTFHQSVISISKTMLRAEPKNDHSHSRNRHFMHDQVQPTDSLVNSALYVDKAGYGWNDKIAPAELLPLATK